MPPHSIHFGLTLLLALTVGIGPLSINLVLPSLPAIAQEFAVPEVSAQATISAYMAAFAIGQLIVGPISDRIGRKPVLLFGLGAFVLANIACVFATNITTVIVLRAVQGLTATAPIVLARSVVRDLFEGSAAARQLALMGSVTGFVPVIAPIAGGVVEFYAGWRYDFAIIALLAVVNFAAILFWLPETLRTRLAEPFSPAHLARGYGVILASPTFRLYCGIVVLTFTGLFTLIAGLPFVLQGAYGLDPVMFGFVFGSNALAYIGGSFLSFRLVGRLGIDRVLSVGVIILALGGLAQLGGFLLASGHVAEIIGPFMLFSLGMGLTIPQGMAGTIQPFPERAGSASSLMGFFQMTFAAIAAILVGHFLGDRPWILGVAVFALGTGAFLAFNLARSARISSGAA